MEAIAKPMYSDEEEIFNTISHGIGLLFSIPALILLVVYASLYGDVWHIVSFSIYGSSLIILYLASTLYHGVKNPILKHKLNIFDHSAIYLLIAGTYTPFTLVTLSGAWRWSIFGVIWGLAIVGIVYKFFFIGKFRTISAIAYIIMGFVIIIAIKPLVNSLAPGGLWLLLLGGISYSGGVIFYVKKNMLYAHGIFHIFVLLGSLLHFLSVFFYVL